MRTIKFRGKAADGWHYGDLRTDTSNGDCTSIYDGVTPRLDWEVVPETVGQLTGLKDRNGLDIYEGDVVQHKDGRYFTVIFDDFSFLFNNGCISYHLEARDGLDVEVIGNIHDKKDLMQENKKQN